MTIIRQLQVPSRRIDIVCMVGPLAWLPGGTAGIWGSARWDVAGCAIVDISIGLLGSVARGSAGPPLSVRDGVLTAIFACMWTKDREQGAGPDLLPVPVRRLLIGPTDSPQCSSGDMATWELFALERLVAKNTKTDANWNTFNTSGRIMAFVLWRCWGRACGGYIRISIDVSANRMELPFK